MTPIGIYPLHRVAHSPWRDGLEMVKLSISLPNTTQITLESEEAGVIHEVLGMVLSGMDLNAAPASVTAPHHEAGGNGVVEKGTDAVEEYESPAVARQVNGVAVSQSITSTPTETVDATSNGRAIHPPPPSEVSDDSLDLGRQPQQAREDYRAFCQSLNPMGDMRRVVVAAEAANRFFGWDGVSADVLGELFDLSGWRRANSFTQTLRNAARSKFGWLERIPGRSGRYAATDVGRSIIFGA